MRPTPFVDKKHLKLVKIKDLFVHLRPHFFVKKNRAIVH